MADIKNIGDIDLQPVEYGYLYGDQSYTNTEYRITLPRLMPNLINITDNVINKNIFLNDASCKPNPRNISLQEYITVPISNQCSLLQPMVQSPTQTIADGTRVLCTCLSGNVKDLLITDYK